MTFNNHNNQRGFTLLESMVAITILLVAVVGPMSTIGNALSDIYTARDQMLAINLAQEGVETMRQLRDSDMLTLWNGGTTTWSDHLIAGNYVVTDTNGVPGVSKCSASACTQGEAAVYQDMQGYHQGTVGSLGVPTKFTRDILITDASSAEKIVTSTVTWKTSTGVDRKIQVVESLFGINTP